MTTPPRSLRCALLLAATTLLAWNGNVDGDLDLFHEGERLAHHDELAQGGLPYRDFYVPHGLGEDVLKPLLATRLHGESVEGLRRLGQNSYLYRGWLPPLGLLSLALAGCVLLRSASWLALLCALLATGLLEVSERYALGFLAVAALGAYASGERPRWLGLAGALTVLAGLYSTEVGIFLFSVTLVWLLTLRPRRARSLLPFGYGVALTAIPFLGWCLLRGITGDFFENLYIQLVLRREIWPSSYPVPSGPSALLLYYLVPAVALSGAVLAIRTGCKRLSLAALTACAFWLTVAGRPDIWHVAYAAGAVYLFLAVAARETLSLDATRRRWGAHGRRRAPARRADPGPGG